MAKRRRSFGQKKEQTNKQIFVGRQEQLQLFERIINLGPDHEDFINIFNIYGQGGVGKTTLTHKYHEAAKAANYWIGFVDTEDLQLYEVTATMNNIAKDFDFQGANFKRFTKRYKDYLQKKGELDADPNRPKGTFGKLIEAGIKTSASVGADFLPGGNAMKKYLPVDAMANAAGEYSNYLFKKFNNKDDVELMLYPLKVLTPLWLEDLYDAADKKNGVLFFDTYEAANPALDKWLYDLLHAKYGEFPDNIILSIGGRDMLDPARWNTLRAFTEKIPLEPFTEEEAKNYLAERGITHPKAVKDILSISGRLPVYLSLLAENDPASPDDISDPNEKIVERFLKHIKDPLQRKLALEAALPQKLDKDIIACLLPPEADANALFDWLKSRPFVQKRGGHWAYHPIVRDTMLRHQREISPMDWESIHLKLADWYEQRAKRLQTEGDRVIWMEDEAWRLLQIGKYFHQLCSNYKQYIPTLMQDVALLFYKNPWHDLIPFTVLLSEVEKIMGIDEWGTLINTCVAALIADKREGILDFLKKINQTNWVENPKHQSYLFFAQGVYEKDKTIEINCYDHAIQLNPQDANAFNNRGNLLDDLDRKEEALSDYNKAIELNPQYANAFYNRGNLLKNLDRKEEALSDYNKAIELNPKDATAYNNRGILLENLDRKEEALSDYNKAIELNPQDANAFNNRGILLENLDRKEEALSDYNKAIQLNPKDATAYNNRGILLVDLDRKEDALNDYNQVVKLNPENSAAFGKIGWIALILHKLKESEKAFLKEIELKKQNAAYHPFMNLGHIYLIQKNTPKAIEWYKKAIESCKDTAQLEEFYEGMESDYSEIKMSELHITTEAYQKIIAQLKKDHHE